MQKLIKPLAVLAACALPVAPHFVAAQPGGAIPLAITTPDRVNSRLGSEIELVR